MRLRESAQARRADVEIDPDKVAFQAALGKLSNWQRTRYQRDGTPGSLENVGYYAALARG